MSSAAVDTHKRTHYAAVIDDNGRHLGHREFPANARGYASLLNWMRSHGGVRVIGGREQRIFRCRPDAIPR